MVFANTLCQLTDGVKRLGQKFGFRAAHGRYAQNDRRKIVSIAERR